MYRADYCLKHFEIRLVKCFFIRVLSCVFILFAGGYASAQSSLQVTQILYEPHLIPASGEVLPLRELSGLLGTHDTGAVSETEISAQRSAEINRNIRAYLEYIGDMETLEGPYSDRLREDLFSTGLLYQELEDHEEALDYFARALSVSRINYGLQSLDQVAILEAMSESYYAINDLKLADEMKEAGYQVKLKAYGEESVELVSAMHELGNWEMDAFLERSNMLLNIPRMNVRNFMDDPINYIQPDNDLRNSPLFKLFQAQSNYLNAIRILIDNKAYYHPELLTLERKVLTTFFLHTHRENILYEPDFYLTRKKSKTGSRLNQNQIELMTSENYEKGQESIKRSIAYVSSDPDGTLEELALIMLEEADWDLLHGRKVRAAQKYADAYALFSETTAHSAALTKIIYPDLPVVLPDFLPAPNSREKLKISPDERVDYFGYIDVSFSINKYGKARKVKILDTVGDVSRNMEIRLNQYLRNVLFRPRFNEGRSATEVISLRYYLGA